MKQSRRQNPVNLSFAKTTVNVVAIKVVCIYLRGRIQRKTWCLGLYAGDDYNLALCPFHSRLQHIYHGQPYAKVDLNPMPESTLTLCQSRLFPPVRDFGFGL